MEEVRELKRKVDGREKKGFRGMRRKKEKEDKIIVLCEMKYRGDITNLAATLIFAFLAELGLKSDRNLLFSSALVFRFFRALFFFPFPFLPFSSIDRS